MIVCNCIFCACNCIFCLSQSGKISDVPKWEALFPYWASQMSYVPDRDTQCRKNIDFKHPNNPFPRHFKKVVNGQKLDDLFIFKLLKVCGDSSKTVIHLLSFSEGTKNDQMMPDCVSSY